MRHKIGILLLLFLAESVLGAAGAQARIFIGGGVVLGAPYYEYPPYYSYYPPLYAYPPPYAPPDYVYAPPPSSYDRYYSGSGGEYCREYTHTVTIGAAPQTVYGHACRQADGNWHIVD